MTLTGQNILRVNNSIETSQEKGHFLKNQRFLQFFGFWSFFRESVLFNRPYLNKLKFYKNYDYKRCRLGNQTKSGILDFQLLLNVPLHCVFDSFLIFFFGHVIYQNLAQILSYILVYNMPRGRYQKIGHKHNARVRHGEVQNSGSCRATKSGNSGFCLVAAD